MASKTYYVGFNGLISRLDNLNFDPNGNTYTNWVNLRTYFDQSFNINPQGLGQNLWDVMTIPGNQTKVFVVGSINTTTLPWQGIAYSTTAGQNTTNPNQSFLTPGFPGGAIPAYAQGYISATEGNRFNYYEVWCVDNDTIYACGTAGTVIRSLDGGLTFTLHLVPNALFYPPYNTLSYPADIWSVHFESKDSGAIGSLNQVFLTNTGSTTCTWVSAAATPANTGYIKGIYKKGNLIVAVGQSKIICSLDGGATWTFQYQWSEQIPNPAFPRNGEHLTWHYDPCNNIIYFRATGRRNEIVQTAYDFGSNSFIDPVTSAALTPNTAWSTFNGHVFDPTSGLPSNVAKNYYAAHFYRNFEGFLGRTDADTSAPYEWGWRRVDQYVSNTEILNVDQTATTKDKVLTAIWTEIDPVVYYKIEQCDTQKTYYVQQGTDTANIAGLANQTINNILIDGNPNPYCWNVSGPITCGTYTVSNINTLSAQILTGCDDDLCKNCYKLQNCQDPMDYIIVNPIPALQNAIYQSVSLPDYCPGKCWYVIPDWPCENSQSLPEDIIVTVYKNCNDCQGVVETYDLRPRSVKPGFYTPGCPPEYTVKTSCMYGEQVYDEMVSIRYGVNICCDHDVDKWDIKKQLLELNALYNPELCTSSNPECKEVCNLTATLTVSGPIEPYNPPPPPCKIPRFPNADLNPEAYCYSFSVKSLYPDFAYLRKIYLGYAPNEVEINLTNIITVPVSSSLFPMQLTAALQSYGLQCSGVFYEPFGGLVIYGFNGNLSYATFETIYGGNLTPPLFEDVAPLNIECTEIPDTNCYTVYVESFVLSSGSYLGYLGIYNGSLTVQYDISSLAIQVVPGPLMPMSLPTLVAFVQSKGYDVDDITVQNAGPSASTLTFINFTGGVPAYITYSGQINPPQYDYFSESPLPCGGELP